ncbi:hypothetical protein JOF34_001538 [Microbacterium amylolyticum]|uniref:Uncharacterized protein n=1 Tax=Microbacterium amylolyticum TaxID=936337 RepID=A0ABS4ZIB2_9MICO|nr:hypothetical protein [Microbacterium amylolyticum]
MFEKYNTHLMLKKSDIAEGSVRAVPGDMCLIRERSGWSVNAAADGRPCSIQ